MGLVLLLLIAACLVLAWTPATGALAAVGWTYLDVHRACCNDDTGDCPQCKEPK